MKTIPLYPLKFEPIFQYRLWGGRHLADFVSAPLPNTGPIGEAWILSDRDDFPSTVADGPLRGMTLKGLIEEHPNAMLGKLAGVYSRFPLLLKFLDVTETLSVQVHPSDKDREYIPRGENGKTEAWVVLAPGIESRVYAGLTPGATDQILRQALACNSIAEHLSSFEPVEGDVVLIPAGTVHSLGDVVVFEVQQNSDVTFRLFDWNHIDSKTGQPRPLQIDQAIACIDFLQGVVSPLLPLVEEEKPVMRERLVSCKHFEMWRVTGEWSFVVGETDTPRVIVCLSGDGNLKFEGEKYHIAKGDVLLLPAVVGACVLEPFSKMVVLEIAIPEEM